MRDLKTQMLEKYLHSQGAVLFEEGRVDDAILFFERAIALDDRSYTRCDLGLAFKQKNDVDRGLREIDRAIALNPGIARYHYERCLLQRMKGHESEARRDLERAIELDENYSRIDEIQEALKTLEEATSRSGVAVFHHQKRIRDPELADVLARVKTGVGLTRIELEAVSCTLPCPAFCCYFEGSPLLHGVSIGPWKLLNIRELLRQKGLREDDFLERTELTGQRELQSLIPPHHLLRERGDTCVYSPKRGRSTLDPAFVASVPKGRAYQDLFWIHGDSCECSFLQNGRCTIHDVGDEPALPACKEFLCLTGFVFALLAQLDLVETKAIIGKTMAQLNRLAVDAALIVSKELFQAEDLNTMKRSLEAIVPDALNADSQDDRAQIDYLISRVQELNFSLTKALAVRKATVQGRLAEMLDAAPTVEHV
jgi:hypothetical protein